MTEPKRYALVGTGGRAKMFVDALTQTYAEQHQLVALCDTSRVRLSAYQKLITEFYGLPPVGLYHATSFDQMLTETHPDFVIVTTVDSTHHTYIIRAMELGCDVITEKPMTTDLAKAQAIFSAIERTHRRLVVTFNYRYMPIATAIRQLIHDGVIGQPLRVDFMWTLDVRHGADYFRRWHRERDQSGGLLVHKATHHFDLVNWWVGSHPIEVFALGDLLFYGRENAAQRGEYYSYDRYTGIPEAAEDPFALRLDEEMELKAIYLDAEAETGYIRDRNVFGDNISIDDSMCVMARYANGVHLSYSLVAFSPWEGFRVAITGTHGRLEADETDVGVLFVAGQEETLSRITPVNIRTANLPEQSLRVFPMWGEPYEVDLEMQSAGHGGADEALLHDLFAPAPPPDLLKRRASHVDGAASVLLGIAANTSIRERRLVTISSIDPPDLESGVAVCDDAR